MKSELIWSRFPLNKCGIGGSTAHHQTLNVKLMNDRMKRTTDEMIYQK